MRLGEFRLGGLDGLSALIWPDFVVVNGCVVRAGCYDEAVFADWWESHGSTPWAIETVLSEEHFYDLVTDLDEKDLPRLEAIAKRVAECWRIALAHRFPERRFVVIFGTEPDQYGPTISFHQSDGCPGCREGLHSDAV